MTASAPLDGMRPARARYRAEATTDLEVVEARVRERLEAAICAAMDGGGAARVAVHTALERVGARRACWTPGLVAEALLAGYPLVGRARAVVCGRPGTPQAWWQADEAGRDVVTVAEAAWLPSGALAVDEVVACDPAEPARWWRLTGGSWALGESLLAPEHGKLHLVRRPLAWARAGGAATALGCVLDWTAPAAIALLLAEVDLVTCDPAEGARSAADIRVDHGEALARRVREARPRGAQVRVLDEGPPREAQAA